MASLDAGPATGSGVLAGGVPGAASGAGGFAQVESIEVHVPNGLPSLEPSRAPFIDPNANAFNVNSVPLTPINTQFVMGVTGATVKFVNPA